MDRNLLARVEQQAWFHRYPRGLPLLIFLFCCAAIALAVIGIERGEKENRDLDLARSSAEVAGGLQRRAAENMAVLSAAGALFGSVGDISRGSFTEFVRTVNADDVYHGSMGIGWAPWVNRGSVRAFEMGVSEQTGGEFRIRPAPDPVARAAVPILYLFPQTGPNRSAVGFDMYSEAVRRQAMERSVQLGRPVASGPVRLVQDAGAPDEAGFLIYMPVYDGPQESGNVRGFVYSPFNARDFLESAAQLNDEQHVDVAIYDTSRSEENLLVSTSAAELTGTVLEMPIQVANRNWIIAVSNNETPGLTTLSTVTLLFGFALATLLMVLARLITRRAAEDRVVLEWLSSQAAIRDSLTRELNHRVKNTLANVLSIISLARRRYDNIDSFAESLDGRVRALSATHDLLSQSDWSNAALRSVVERELAPYIQPDAQSVEISGDDFSLAPNDALSLGLAIHELATNAAKYGALSVAEGRVDISWHKVAEDRIAVEWQESGGPPVTEPSSRGFGRELLEKIVAHELQSEVKLRFDPGGLSCSLQVPLRAQTEFALRGRDALRQARQS